VELPIVEDLITGKDGEVSAAHIRTSNCSTTRLVSRLYPLKEPSDESGKAATNSAQEKSQHSADSAQQEDQEKTPMTRTHRHKGNEQDKRVEKCARPPPGGCIELSNYI